MDGNDEILTPPVDESDRDDQPQIARLRAQVALLRAELAQARAWAWSLEHRHLSGGWLTYEGDPSDPATGWDWVYPDWLVSPVEPDQQEWWIQPHP